MSDLQYYLSRNSSPYGDVTDFQLNREESPAFDSRRQRYGNSAGSTPQKLLQSRCINQNNPRLLTWNLSLTDDQDQVSQHFLRMYYEPTIVAEKFGPAISMVPENIRKQADELFKPSEINPNEIFDSVNMKVSWILPYSYRQYLKSLPQNVLDKKEKHVLCPWTQWDNNGAHPTSVHLSRQQPHRSPLANSVGASPAASSDRSSLSTLSSASLYALTAAAVLNGSNYTYNNSSNDNSYNNSYSHSYNNSYNNSNNNSYNNSNNNSSFGHCAAGEVAAADTSSASDLSCLFGTTTADDWSSGYRYWTMSTPQQQQQQQQQRLQPAQQNQMQQQLQLQQQLRQYRQQQMQSAESPSDRGCSVSSSDLDDDDYDYDGSPPQQQQQQQQTPTASSGQCWPSFMLQAASTDTDTGIKKLVEHYCTFCYKNHEPPEVYGSHLVRDATRTTCPKLRALRCKHCNSTGDNAHTMKYCPYVYANYS